MKSVHFVIPVYNENEATLSELGRRISETLAGEDVSAQVFFVDDGSDETTARALDALVLRYENFTVVRLSRNFGHQPAISAGLAFADADAAVFMDSDLQDPPEAVKLMLEWWRKGYQVVYAVRKNRKENAVKRTSYFLFYRLLRLLADIPLPVDSGDFCLVDRKVLNVLRSLPERHRFHRGLRTWAGFKQKAVEIERDARVGGEPKLGFFKLIDLAISGLISFSIKPLRVAIFIGLMELFGSMAFGFYILVSRLLGVPVIKGWTSLTLITLFSSGIIIFLLGVIGEYLGQVFLESKGRPSFVIADVIRRDSPPDSAHE